MRLVRGALSLVLGLVVLPIVTIVISIMFFANAVQEIANNAGIKTDLGTTKEIDNSAADQVSEPKLGPLTLPKVTLPTDMPTISLPDVPSIKELAPAKPVKATPSATLIKKARTWCIDVLPEKKYRSTCSSLPIRTENLSSGVAGETRSSTLRINGKPGTITPTEMVLSSDLLRDNDTYARQVAVHEWHHVRQILAHSKEQDHEALEAAANSYFDPKVKASLKGSPVGLELLTDCATALKSNGSAGPNRGNLLGYVSAYAPQSNSMKSFCGTGWQKLYR